MRRLWFAPVVLLAACGGDDPVTSEIVATVTHYDYTFDVESRVAHAEITVDVTEPGGCLTLPFRATSPANVTLAGGATQSTIRDGVLEACNTDGVGAGDAVLALDLTIPEGTVGGSQVGYSRTVDNSGNALYYLVSWVGGCDRFAPCDARADQFATYTFTVTHPDTHQIACPGTITEISATQTVCSFDLPGGPTYSTFGVAAYPRAAWVETDKGMWGSAHATVYSLPTNLVASKIDTAHHAGFVTFLESTFGAYPYGSELRIHVAPTYWNGFEHPGSIMLDSGLGRADGPYTNPVRHVLDHEIAHQWAGDETTLADTYDFVWKEAMVEYLTFVYEDMTEPASARGTATYWKAASRGAGYFPVPADRPELFDYYGDVYGPGPMILFRQIEAMASREQVIAALQSLLGEQRAISVDDVVAALAASTGLDLGAYAAAWIHGSGAPQWPTVELTLVSQTQLSVALVSGQERRCAFHVALRGTEMTDVQKVAVDTRVAPTQTIDFTAPFTVESVELDPDRECLVYPVGTTARRVVPHPWLSQRALDALAAE